MPKTTEYRLTIREVGPMPIEWLGHGRRGAITLGQWAERDHAFLAMTLYQADNPQSYAAGAGIARLVVTTVLR